MLLTAVAAGIRKVKKPVTGTTISSTISQKLRSLGRRRHLLKESRAGQWAPARRLKTTSGTTSWPR